MSARGYWLPLRLRESNLSWLWRRPRNLRWLWRRPRIKTSTMFEWRLWKHSGKKRFTRSKTNRCILWANEMSSTGRRASSTSYDPRPSTTTRSSRRARWEKISAPIAQSAGQHSSKTIWILWLEINQSSPSQLLRFTAHIMILSKLSKTQTSSQTRRELFGSKIISFPHFNLKEGLISQT